MTYRNMVKLASQMNDEQLDSDVTVLLMNSDEVVPVSDFVSNWDTMLNHREEVGLDQVSGILDENHPYLTVAF